MRTEKFRQGVRLCGTSMIRNHKFTISQVKYTVVLTSDENCKAFLWGPASEISQTVVVEQLRGLM